MDRTLLVKLLRNKRNKSVLVQIPKLKLSPSIRKKLNQSQHARVRFEEFL